MSLLGAYFKQPVEVEIYSIQYNKDLSTTDELQSAWQILSSSYATAWDQVSLTDVYTILLTDSERIIVTISGVSFPVGASEGFRFYVSNKSQTFGITVGTFIVPARGAIAVVLKNGVWVVEASIEGTLVNILQDQRVRTRFLGGAAWEDYKVQVTVDTAEGRTLQDEFIVTIEEV
jgi:hypothetical protein